MSVIEAGIDATRVHVVHNVVSADEIQPDPEGARQLRAELGIADDAFVVGCVSRFHPKKRNDVAIDAALLLAADGGARPVELVMAGDGETEAELRARAAPLGGAAHFIPTPGSRLTSVLSASDTVVFCPSPTEGAPRAVILSMLCERPTVAAGAEGVAGLLEPEDIAVPEHDAAAVAALLRGYRDDPLRAQAVGAAARRRATATHDPAAIAAQVEALFTRR
jgi:glycosyltransferase involved in cell wall biosynthesis